MSKHSGWFPYDRNADQGALSRTNRSARVIGIGAICDFATGAPEQGPSQSFSVKEFLELEDGRYVVVDNRGFTSSSVRELQVLEDGRHVVLENVAHAGTGFTPESMRQQVLNVVLPDDDECVEAHPWAWLAEQARKQGIDVTPGELKALTYQVILTERLAEWLKTP